MTAPRPYRSKLQPFEAEIAAMRQKRPPMPYREIARILKERHGVDVQLSTLANFVKVRSKGKRNSYLFGPPWHRVGTLLPRHTKMPSTKHPDDSDSAMPQGKKAEDAPFRPRRPVAFTFSEQYNLTRLTPEEKAALEKKLDEELKGKS
jgi:hypothetical protein